MSLSNENGLVMPVSPMMNGYNNGGFGFGGDGAWWLIVLFLFLFLEVRNAFVQNTIQ